MTGLPPAATWLISAAVLLAAACCPAVSAQDTGQPARAIRLSDIDGKVTLSQGGQVTSDQAVVNTPLVQGMNLTTADNGRAEIQFEDGSVARIAPNSSLTLAVLSGSGSSGDAEMDLDHGLAYFELQGSDQVGTMRIRFGDNVITASGFTVVRVTDDTPPAEVAVFSGNAHIDQASGSSVDLQGGESVSFNSSDPNGYVLAESIPPNSWDSWNSDRDQALSAEASAQTNAPADLAPGETSNPAWSDLDANGSWYNVPDQGYVWSPYDAANPGFDPYGNGSWVWTPGFGYTWASAYNWGYLPYSCGAWNYYNGFGWGWAPGFGGCTPWWGAGYYAGPVIGFAPSWYRPIDRPHWDHFRRGIPRQGPIHGRPIPVIAVHREPHVTTAALPPRDHDAPVSIGGHTVFGLRPALGRPPYVASSFANRPGFPRRNLPPAPQYGRPGVVPNRPVYIHPAQGFGNTRGSEPVRTYSVPGNRGSIGAPNRSAPTPRVYAPPVNRGPGENRGAPAGGGYHGAPAGGGGFHGGGGGGGGAHGGGGGGHR